MIYNKMGQLCRDKKKRAYRVGMPIQVRTSNEDRHRGLFGSLASIRTGDDRTDNLSELELHCKLIKPYDPRKRAQYLGSYPSDSLIATLEKGTHIAVAFPNNVIMESVALLGIGKHIHTGTLWVQYMDHQLLKHWFNGKKAKSDAEFEDSVEMVPLTKGTIGRLAASVLFSPGQTNTIGLQLYEQLKDKWYELDQELAG